MTEISWEQFVADRAVDTLTGSEKIIVSDNGAVGDNATDDGDAMSKRATDWTDL